MHCGFDTSTLKADLVKSRQKILKTKVKVQVKNKKNETLMLFYCLIRYLGKLQNFALT